MVSPKAAIVEAGADAAVAEAAGVMAGIVDRSVVVIGIEIEAGNALRSPVSRGLSKAVLPRGRRRATNPFCCPESRSPNISAGANSRRCSNRSPEKPLLMFQMISPNRLRLLLPQRFPKMSRSLRRDRPFLSLCTSNTKMQELFRRSLLNRLQRQPDGIGNFGVRKNRARRLRHGLLRLLYQS